MPIGADAPIDLPGSIAAYFAADVTDTVRLTGESPGSPIELRYRVVLADDKIARLEITA